MILLNEMIELLIACSPRLDGQPTFCPPDNYFLERKETKPKVIKDRDFMTPFQYVTIPIWRYEFK
tara:strand:- start:81 stop:275 length:195 start_codon:yes stop_codon:yes gene_type:complete